MSEMLDYKLPSWVQMKQAGVPVAEFNLDTSGATEVCDFVFQVCKAIITHMAVT